MSRNSLAAMTGLTKYAPLLPVPRWGQLLSTFAATARAGHLWPAAGWERSRTCTAGPAAPPPSPGAVAHDSSVSDTGSHQPSGSKVTLKNIAWVATARS